ncbi:hypothetical protein [Thiomicrorhabdus sp. Milos-T2]|uniref:c-type cytochrome n=1 Tax=Thiomicrorhabdus sp. Milos-T2 TaxID=90814 RepID=UPI0006924F02|nr:hypothetical protein [Thiomicrorhabdus sp. Milos-T2]
MKLYKAPFILSSLTMAVMLASCGGGGSDSTTTSTSTSTSASVVTGTVPGTLIEAFCADGTFYSENSTNNGTTKHPFSISLPSNVDCRLVMTTNENDPVKRVVTPINLDNNGTISGLINLSGDIDLGHVPLALNAPNVDLNHDGVEDTPLKVSISSASVTTKQVTYDPLDTDGDGIPNVYEDDDKDGVSNHYDNDYLSSRKRDDRDGDGINDLYDRDNDNDGLTDDRDNDDDNDGIKDSEEVDHDDSQDTNASTSTVPTPVQNYTATTGRLLVSQCAQCHGTNGQSVTSWDSITGEANELASEMFDQGGIMLAQAHGYSSTEIQAMAAWLGSQPNASNDQDN